MSATLSPESELPAASLAVEGAAEAPRPRFYRPELDRLRFFAFLGVFLFHLYGVVPVARGSVPPLVKAIVEWTASVFLAGHAGVDLFFVLSSYLITELLLREYRQHGRVDVRRFYLRRALRIWPLYYAFLAWAFFLERSWLGNAGLTGEFAGPFALFLGNWSFVGRDTLPDTTATILWTVSIEEQFYLAWPLLLAVLTPRRMGPLAIGMLVVSNLTRLYLTNAGATYYGLHCNTFARLDGIAAGALVAVWLDGRVPELSRTVRRGLAVGGLLLLVASTRAHFLRQPFALSPLAYYPAMTASAVLLLLATLGKDAGRVSVTNGATRSTSFLVFLGGISYGLYVFHMPSIHVTDRWIAAGLVPSAARGFAAFGLTAAVAIASYYVLERPFLRWKERLAVVASRAA